MNLTDRTLLITGAARRIGRELALAAARAGADVILHHGHSPAEAGSVADQVCAAGRQAWVIQQDLADLSTVASLVDRAFALHPFDGLVNSAAIFENLDLAHTTLSDFQRHLDINLTAPFLLSQAFSARLPVDVNGRILNILDWRALRPGPDHFPYTVSKAALAAMTQSLAAALAPRIQVNGLALGAILPPADGSNPSGVLQQVPAARWATMQEVTDSALFLLGGPEYITGEIIHLDGGRHLI